MPSFKTLDDLGDLTGKVALVRVDLNLPMQDGSATDVTRVEASKDTILELADKGAKVLLLAHFGRPKGQRNSTMSTSYVQSDVGKVLGRGAVADAAGRDGRLRGDQARDDAAAGVTRLAALPLFAPERIVVGAPAHRLPCAR